MKSKNQKSPKETLFGFRFRRQRTADAGDIKTKPVPAVFDKSGTALHKRRRPRIIGVTEQRLRARNQGSWMLNAKAWKKFMRGFTKPAKG